MSDRATRHDPKPQVGKVLIIDDERESRDLLAIHLANDGYEVLTAGYGPEGLKSAFEHRPDAVILDIRMPGMDGYEVCGRLRDFSSAAILFVTVVRETEGILRGLQMGADDYVIKPFEYLELAARLKACLRRKQRTRPIEPGPLLAAWPVDRARREVNVRGRRVQLTPKEFEVLEFLMERPDRVLSVDEILDGSWGQQYVGDHDLVKQFIKRLRAKLEDDPTEPRYIVTVRGSGYAFEPDTRPSQHAQRAELDQSPAPDARDVPELRQVSEFRGKAQRWAELAVGEVGEGLGTGAEDLGVRLRSGATGGEASALGSAAAKTMKLEKVGVRLGAVLLILLAMLSAGMVGQAAGNSLPGDGIYSVKSAVEELRLMATGSPAGEVELHLVHSEARILEMSELLARDRPVDVSLALALLEEDLARAAWLLDRMAENDPTEAVKLAAVMERNLSFQVEALLSLKESWPDQAREAIDRAIEVSEIGRARAEEVLKSNAASNLSDRLRESAEQDQLVTAPPEEQTGVATPTPAPADPSRSEDAGNGGH